MQSESILSVLLVLRSGLLKDRHDINKSAGVLGDLMRSGLPKDSLYLNTINAVRKYAERPTEKQAT